VPRPGSRAALAAATGLVVLAALAELSFAAHPLRGTGIWARLEMVAIPASFAVAGLVLGWSGRSRRTAWQLVLAGALLLALNAASSRTPLVFTLTAFQSAAVPVIVAALLGYPHGRLPGWRDRALVAGATVGWLIPAVNTLFYDPADAGCQDCPPGLNLVLVRSDPEHVVRWQGYAIWILIGVLAGLMAALLHRWATAPPPARRVRGPLLLPAVAWAGSYLAYLVLQKIDLVTVYAAPTAAYTVLVEVLLAGLLLLPVGLAAGVIRTRSRRAAVDELVLALEGRGDVDEVLARALGDAGVQLAVWSPDDQRFADRDGRTVEPPPAGGNRTATRLEDDEGGPLALLLHDESLLDQPAMLAPVVTATRLALIADRLRATVREQLEEVRESRAKVVAAADAERRRIERDLHDGAQARLVSLAFALELTRTRLPDDADPALAEAVARAQREARQALGDLRALSRGIVPPTLASQGLAAAVDVLVDGLPLTVDVDLPSQRLPGPVETAAYYVVAEALTNSVKHAPGARAAVSYAVRDGRLTVCVRDDGAGGAEVQQGGGLDGLRDRVEALGGRLRVASTPGAGTVVEAVLPCGS
jgi:signal transduction histidine kinase